jgi:hypothetical protein
MGVIMSMVKTLKEFVMKKEKVKEKEKEKILTCFGPIGPLLNIPQVPHVPAINKLRLILREEDEVNRIHKHHDEWAERINKGCDRRTDLADAEDFRQRRLQAVPAVVKRRALKIQREAEREADPVKMAKYLAHCKKQCEYRWNWLCKQTDSEREEMYQNKRNALRITTPP